MAANNVRDLDEAADFVACEMLTDNAEGLTSAISEALLRTRSARLRVTKKDGKGASAKVAKAGKQYVTLTVAVYWQTIYSCLGLCLIKLTAI